MSITNTNTIFYNYTSNTVLLEKVFSQTHYKIQTNSKHNYDTFIVCN